MAPPLEIYVDGKGSSFRTAERAYLRLSVSTTSTDQSQAFHEVQSAVAKITSAFRVLATKTEDGLPHADAAVTAFTVTPLSTTSRYQVDLNYRPLVDQPKEHTVSASAEVVFRDMARLADVSNELATTAHVSVTDTEWKLTDGTRAELEREARLKAIRDAVAKAHDYAGVVGRRVAAVEIRDKPQETQLTQFGRRIMGWPLAQHQQQMQMQMMQQQQQAARNSQRLGAMSTSASSGDGIASEGPSLEPKTITVAASVSAKFMSTDGDEDNGLEVGRLGENLAKRPRV
ncbi:hypothetical protein N657DRAFT_643196 [Parathielavia appendiculata]|uniref:Uncharacterized protein n=1 Tax=Parathielavia appendiculata TaxID=2587402 RepID=A0AAN6Z6I4_9PEZI|nr:hypothetical protein N657DRAFT_643196 [Parathielavia appendiculata]